MDWLGQSSSSNSQPSYGQSSYGQTFPQNVAQKYGLNGQITYNNGTYMHNGTHNVSYLHPNFSGQLIYSTSPNPNDNTATKYTVQNGQLFDSTNGNPWDGYTQLYDNSGVPYDSNSLQQIHNKKGLFGGILGFGGRRRRRKTSKKGGKKSKKSRRRRTSRM